MREKEGGRGDEGEKTKGKNRTYTADFLGFNL